jgi:hypothetical protein
VAINIAKLVFLYAQVVKVRRVRIVFLYWTPVKSARRIFHYAESASQTTMTDIFAVSANVRQFVDNVNVVCIAEPFLQDKMVFNYLGRGRQSFVILDVEGSPSSILDVEGRGK